MSSFDREEPQRTEDNQAPTESPQVMEEGGDITLHCRDCGLSFIFSAGEQEFYRAKDFEGPPTRCKPCRAQKKASRESQDGSSFGGHMNYMMMDAYGNPIFYQMPQRPPNLRTKPCHAFRRGECNYGAECRYYHDDGSQGPQSLYLNPPQPMFSGGFPPGGIYMDPNMTNGGAMIQNSTVEGGSGGNDVSPRNNGNHRRGGKSRNPCFAFQRGECNLGDNCRYQHVDASGMTDANGNPIVVPPPRPRGYCHAFARGECRFGNTCKFRHEIPAKVDENFHQKYQNVS